MEVELKYLIDEDRLAVVGPIRYFDFLEPVCSFRQHLFQRRFIDRIDFTFDRFLCDHMGKAQDQSGYRADRK